MNELDNLREMVANGKLEKVFDELQKISKTIKDKELRNSILLNCFSYKTVYKNRLLNISDDIKELNTVVIATLDFIDEVEEYLKNPKTKKGVGTKGQRESIIASELPEKLTAKIERLINKHLSDVFIDEGDIEKTIIKSGITAKQFETVLIVVRENFNFFQKKFSMTSGMTISNCVSYAIDALFVDEKNWTGSNGRKVVTKAFQEMITKKK